MAPLTRAAARAAALPGASTSTSTTPRVLVVFDFDESLVDEDSDVYFLKSLNPQLLMEMLASMQVQVTEAGHSAVADRALGLFHERMPHITREQIRDTAARVPVSPKMLAAIKRAVDTHHATVVIASDANEYFIRSMLDHNDMTAYVSEIHANKTKWETAKSARLRIKPYHAVSKKPHGCEQCPRNLCKGVIIDTLRKKNVYDTVLYVGDGKGDYCPSTRLTSHDTVFARADSAKGRSFGLLKMIKDAPQTVEARVVEWHNGDDIYEQFEKALTAAVVATRRGRCSRDTAQPLRAIQWHAIGPPGDDDWAGEALVPERQNLCDGERDFDLAEQAIQLRLMLGVAHAVSCCRSLAPATHQSFWWRVVLSLWTKDKITHGLDETHVFSETTLPHDKGLHSRTPYAAVNGSRDRAVGTLPAVEWGGTDRVYIATLVARGMPLRDVIGEVLWLRYDGCDARVAQLTVECLRLSSTVRLACGTQELEYFAHMVDDGGWVGVVSPGYGLVWTTASCVVTSRQEEAEGVNRRGSRRRKGSEGIEVPLTSVSMAVAHHVTALLTLLSFTSVNDSHLVDACPTLVTHDHPAQLLTCFLCLESLTLDRCLVERLDPLVDTYRLPRRSTMLCSCSRRSKTFMRATAC